MALCVILLGYVIQRSTFFPLLLSYGAFFVAYILIFGSARSTHDIRYYMLFGIALRLLLLPAFPMLSDDVYRFIWDGRLLLHGWNPFDHLPGYFIDNQILTTRLTPELYALLNSKTYYTIYPPVLQGVFALSAWCFPDSIYGAALAMKSTLLAADAGSIFLLDRLLQRLNIPRRYVLLYALNPLVIIEIAGNLHFEGLMIFFLLSSVHFLSQAGQSLRQDALSATSMALAIASKLLPLMLLPFLIRYLGWRRSFRYFAILGTMLLLLWLPLYNQLFISHFSESLNLYFQRFEFNASVFYLLQYIGQAVNGNNLIRYLGPSLALLAMSSIIVLAAFRRQHHLPDLLENWLFALSIYLLLATTVHPWYLATPVVLSAFTRWRYAIVWSGLVWLSYSHYQGGGFQEHYWLIILEYLGVMAYLIYEWRRRVFFTKT